MTTYLTPKLLAYAFLAAIGSFAGLMLGRPEPALIGAPFLFAIVIGAALHRWPEVHASSRLLSDRVLEGDSVLVEIEVKSATPVARLEIVLRVPEGLTLVDGPPVAALALDAGQSGQIERTVLCRRWGGYRLGEIFVRVRDPLGFFVSEGWGDRGTALRVYPRPEAVRSLLSPAETQVFAGNELSRARGEGIEFADARPFVSGDRVRRINWRLTSRLGQPYINEFHRERNADVVIFLDAFAEARRGDNGTRIEAVRAAATLAERYLQQRDRVGLISFGGILRWLRPAMGSVQRYRIVETLIETDVVFSYAWKEITVIPPSVLPPKALVIALTPLLDERVMHALLDLRARHFDLAIVEVSPAPFIVPPRAEPDELAYRIWELDREVMRERLRRLGVPVAEWQAGQPLEQPILEGASIPALHASRAHLSTAAAAIAGYLALVIYPWRAAPHFEGLLLLGGAAFVVLAAGLIAGWAFAIPWAIGALGCEWIVSLYLRNTTDSLTTAGYGAALLLVAELAYWSTELRTPSRDETPLAIRRALAVAILVLTSLVIGIVAAILSQATISGSLVLLAAGLGALLTALVIVATLVWRPRSSRSQGS